MDHDILFNKWKDILFEYCNKYTLVPSQKIEYNKYNIGSWLNDQKKKISKNTDNIYIKLSTNKYVKDNLDLYLDPDILFNKWKDLL